MDAPNRCKLKVQDYPTMGSVHAAIAKKFKAASTDSHNFAKRMRDTYENAKALCMLYKLMPMFCNEAFEDLFVTKFVHK